MRNGGTGITPVHWAIATMIVENERKKNEYKSRYSKYVERISRPASLTGGQGEKKTPEDVQKAQLLADTSASQYFKIRGDIAGDPFLFSDDRAKLLTLVDSKIDSMCGKSLNATLHPNAANFMAIAPIEGAEYQMGAGEPFSSFDGKIGGPSATSFKWRCYGDAMGAWGNMVTNGSNLTAKIAKLGASGSTDDFLDVAVQNLNPIKIYPLRVNSLSLHRAMLWKMQNSILGCTGCLQISANTLKMECKLVK